MKKLSALILMTLLLTAFCLTAYAGKPADENSVPFGNGFPIGAHYNLNIIGKQDNFSCPAPEFVNGVQVYSNVIFIPRVQGNNPISILMESGKKGPKGEAAASVLEVTDWCTESFPDFNSGNGDSAVMRLPQNENGYAVYARVTGKPGTDEEVSATIVPGLAYVEDEAGNELVLLGLADRSGTASFASDGMILTRTGIDSSVSGKGAQTATNITPLFEWSGEVCYVQTDYDLYCPECSPLELCCVDSDYDGVYENCDLLADVGIVIDGVTVRCPVIDPYGYPYHSVTAQCRTYEYEWVFNISDFAGYLRDIDSAGTYVIQVRFYPL